MDTKLLQVIEASLDFRYYRGGNYKTIISDQWSSMPHMVVGQIIGDSLKTINVHGGHHLVHDGNGYCAQAGILRRSLHMHQRRAMFHWAHLDFFILGGIDLGRLVRFPRVLPTTIGNRIGKINRALLKTLNHFDLNNIVARKRLGMELLSLLLADPTTEINSENLHVLQRVQPALIHMQEHIADPLQVQRLARLQHLSCSRFHELFLQATGLSPGQYQLQLRLQHAQIQLINSKKPIKAIAESIGYTDNHYFSRIFKKHVQLTPSAYRAQGAKLPV